MQKISNLLKSPNLSIYSLIIGSLSTLGYAPYKLYPITIICYAMLYMSKPSKSFWFFLGQAATGCFWLYNSVINYGKLPIVYAALFTLIAFAMNAAIPAILSFIVTARYRFLTWPTWITISEIVRSYFLFSGFPWLLLGYTQIHSPWYKWLMLVGTHGTTWLLALVIACACEIQRKKFLIPVMIWLISPMFLPNTWTKPVGKSYIFSPHKPYYDLQLAELVSNYENVDFIIWPEGVINYVLSQSEKEQLKKINTRHLTIFGGISIADKKLYNSTFAIYPEGRITYHKKYNLIAFGEYWPWPALIKKFYNIPVSFSPADMNDKLIKLDSNTSILPIICYDVSFIKWMLPEAIQAKFLISLHKMIWFNSKNAVMQQIEMAQARSIEIGRPQVFIEQNYGHLLIQPNGSLSKQTRIQGYSGLTPYMLLLKFIFGINSYTTTVDEPPKSS